MNDVHTGAASGRGATARLTPAPIRESTPRPGHPGRFGGRWSTRSPDSLRTLVGVLAAATAVLAIGLAVASVTEPLGTADETAHVDYAVQVWHGHLPVFERGLVFRPPRPAAIPPVQWESQHPPLFYVLVAPLAGPLADAHRWIAATMSVRLVNCLLAFGCVLAIAWVAGLVTGRDRSRWMIVAAAVTSTIGPVIFVAGSAYSDMLYTLLSVLAVGVALLLVKRGPTRGRLVLACLVAAAGALSRSEFVLALFVLAVGLFLGAWMHSQAVPMRRLLAACAVGVLPVLSAAVASGWFFLRNRSLTGSFSGSQPVWAALHLHRHTRSLTQVLDDRTFWTTQVSLLRHPLDGRSSINRPQQLLDSRVMIAVFLLCVGVGVIAVARALYRAIRHRDRVRMVSVGLLLLLPAITGAFEIVYIMGGGGSVSRYLLPATAPICLLVTAALTSVPRRLQPYALGGYLLACIGLFSLWLLRQPHTGATFGGRTPTHVPWIAVLAVPPVLLVLAAIQLWTVRVLRPVPN